MNRAVFLDRDGVINYDDHYVYKIEDIRFIEGIFELLIYLQNKGYLLIIITNQAGIGRGYYTEQEFKTLTNWMLGKFKQQGIHLQKVYYCPYHPNCGIGQYKRDSFYRKPNPGMILLAKREWDIDLSKSLLIGDKETDIEAGINAGIPLNILFRPGVMDGHTKADLVINDLNQIIASGILEYQK
nr:HAD family hydrolase [Neobacillus sp. Marseille-Q6967]